MPRTSRSRNARTTRQVAELAAAVPEVVAHRLARAVRAGPSPSAHDRREFHRMGAEKIAAFHEAWSAMAVEMLRASLRFYTMPSLWTAFVPGPQRSARQRRAALGVFAQGLAPYHRRAVANAKRLRRGA